MMTYRKILGYFLLFISCLAWAALPLIPFLPYAGERLTVWAAGVFIFAEITWWPAVLLLGKEFLDWSRYCWDKCRAVLKGRRD